MSTPHRHRNAPASPESPPKQRSTRRPVRSFVRRHGRITPAQSRALDELWPRFGIEHPGPPLEADAAFSRRAPLILEIGFGNGDSLHAAAAARPEANFLGVEVHRPGVGALFLKLARDNLPNVRVLCADAVDVMRDRIAADSLDEIRIYFPDPWPKKRHHKRRLIQPEFARLLATRMKTGAVLHLATDWEDYAEQMLEVLDHTRGLQNVAGYGCYSPRPGRRPATRFERRGLSRGHQVRDLLYQKEPCK